MRGERCPVSGETAEEDRFNHLSHLLGLVLSVIGAVFLIGYAAVYGDDHILAAVIIYSASLVAMYAASASYHDCKDKRRKHRLKIVDHACIYLLIAGTYTPFAVGPLRTGDGYNLLVIEWGIAVIGIIFKLYTVHRFQVFSTLAYLAMGWLIVFTWPVLIQKLPLSTLLWLAAGGFFYTLGTIFFMWKTLPWKHGVWHLFVLAGSFCHYFAVLDLV